MDDSYVIRTSAEPFRPSRVRRSEPSIPDIAVFTAASARDTYYTPSINMPKFTYFINPAGNPELMNWKMSRKDKKFSETYYERQRRLELERQQKEQLELRRQQEALEEERARAAAKAAQEEEEVTSSRQTSRSRRLLDLLRPKKSQSKPLRGIISLKRRIEERLRLYKFRIGGRQDPKERDDNTDGECEVKDHRRMFLGHAYPEWSRARRLFKSINGSDPNVRRASKDDYPETLKNSMSDDQYRVYLNEQSCERRARKLRRNSSFLHGYVAV